MTVTADQVDGEHAADYGGFLEAPPYVPDVGEIDQEGNVGPRDPKTILQAYDDFTDLPPQVAVDDPVFAHSDGADGSVPSGGRPN